MWAFELNHMFSWPLFFHETTVAPYSMTSTESPLGRLAVTFLPSEWTVGWGPVVLGERAEGLCALSTMIAIVFLVVDSQSVKRKQRSSLRESSWIVLWRGSVAWEMRIMPSCVAQTSLALHYSQFVAQEICSIDPAINPTSYLAAVPTSLRSAPYQEIHLPSMGRRQSIIRDLESP